MWEDGVSWDYSAIVNVHYKEVGQYSWAAVVDCACGKKTFTAVSSNKQHCLRLISRKYRRHARETELHPVPVTN